MFSQFLLILIHIATCITTCIGIDDLCYKRYAANVMQHLATTMSVVNEQKHYVLNNLECCRALCVGRWNWVMMVTNQLMGCGDELNWG
jgi:hypothetical protein